MAAGGSHRCCGPAKCVYNLLVQGSSRAGTWLPLCYLISGGTGSPKNSLQIVIQEVGRMWSAVAAIRGTHLKTFIPLHAKAFPPTALSQVV